MQTAQRRRLCIRGPENQRPATAGAKNLLGGPQGIACLRRLDMQEAIERQPDIPEARAIGHLRRLQQGDRPLAQRAQSRLQQPHFTDSRLLDEQIDQRAERPAATGQFSRQRRIPRFHHACATARQLRGAPQRRMDLFGTNGSGKHRVTTHTVYPYRILHAIEGW